MLGGEKPSRWRPCGPGSADSASRCSPASRQSGHEPWADNTFRFELEEKGTGTVVRFWQNYARELSDDAYGTYNFNWGYYLESLRLLGETGTGKPFQPAQ